MRQKQETLVLAGMCAVVVLLSLAGLVWAVVSGLALTLDGIFIILSCLMMAGIFSLFLFLQLKAAGWIPALKFSRSKATAEDKSAAPAAGESPTEEAK